MGKNCLTQNVFDPKGFFPCESVTHKFLHTKINFFGTQKIFNPTLRNFTQLRTGVTKKKQNFGEKNPNGGEES